MAEYKDALMSALKDAMKNKNNERRDTIRQLQAAIKQIEVDDQKELTTEEEMDVLIKEAKKRRESIEELSNADRETADEERELAIIESFLPEQLSEEEIQELAQAAVDQVGATEMRDMGKVMGILSAQTKGKADGKLVSKIVRDILNS